MPEALVGLVAGLAAGAVMSRSGLCFNRGLRQAVFEHAPKVVRAFAIAVSVQLVLVPVLVIAGSGPIERSAAAGGVALLPAAQVLGGLVFGVGMALAGGCIAGMLWKAGAGSTALAIAIGGFAAGELLVLGPGAGLLEALDASSAGHNGLHELVDVRYEELAPVLGALLLVGLLAPGRQGLAAGVALGAASVLAWLAADVASYGYGLGFVGAADGTRAALTSGGALPYQLWLALGVFTAGALVDGRRLRLADAARSSRAAVGGIFMGVGGSVAHGCNIGHGLTGIPLLSLGSLLATACMAAGALATWRLVLAPRPHIRGRERLSPR